MSLTGGPGSLFCVATGRGHPQYIEGICIFLKEAKGVDVVPDVLLHAGVVAVVLLPHVAEVARGLDQRHVHVEVIGVLENNAGRGADQ